MQQEGGVTAADSSNKGILVGGDGAFHSIGAVQVRQNELESDAGVSHELFEAVWALVVEHFKERRKTTVGEVSVEGGVRANKFVLAARFEWLCDNGTTVIVVENHEVCAAATGTDGETTFLVRGDPAGDFDRLQKYHFGLDAGFRGGEQKASSFLAYCCLCKGWW